MSDPVMTRIDELQADAAMWGLDDQSQQELDLALRQAGLDLDPSWERSAAVATLALQQAVPSAPSPWLMAALRAAAPVPQSKPVAPVLRLLAHPNSILAAALLTLAVVVWWGRDTRSDPHKMAPVALRQELLHAGDTAVWQWSGGKAHGDVVWHGGSQRGTMRFLDLPANDPAKQQYQLWIVDAKRNAAQPVDGGVFDVPAGETEVVIPIDPKVVVHDAQAFVVTVEAPGGVVVSDREQIVVLAKPQ